MKIKLSNVLIAVGSIMVLAALALFSYNQWESSQADQATMELLPKLVDEIESNQSETIGQEGPSGTESLLDPYSTVMDTVSVDGHDYIGYLMIPSLNMEQPIMSDWSMKKLKIASCRYYGSVNGNDLVLMGHNYDRGFARLSKIEIGAEVYFRDVNGITTAYKVVETDILAPTSVEEMVSGEYDLTLFTCTYGGKTRRTIRCDKIS